MSIDAKMPNGLTLFQQGKDTFYNRDTSDKAQFSLRVLDTDLGGSTSRSEIEAPPKFK